MRGWIKSHGDKVQSFAPDADYVRAIRLHSPATASGSNRLQLLNDINKLGWNKIYSISEDLQIITMRINDVEAHLTVSISHNYPVNSPKLSTSLFPDQEYAWHETKDLAYLYQLYSNSVLKYSRYFEVLNTFNQEACIVDSKWMGLPVNAMTNDSLTNYLVPAIALRTVLIRAQPAVVYGEIIIKPDQIMEPPDCRFYGPGVPHNDILHKSWSANKRWWSANLSIARNLEKILDIVLPQPSSLNETKAQNETENFSSAPMCDICYDQGLDQLVAFSLSTPMPSLPEVQITCQNSKCHHLYHKECIRGWLISGGMCKVSFGVLFGLCPYCGSNIELPV
mmetsp:Transcript_4794/g.9729  ORF Transcript_4794/g.9729 Transcript_4794/m.9729 type:complete len:337 (+) Transcript_4794:30-1040(+)